jgi:hypothetical protein
LAEALATPIVQDLKADMWERTYGTQILCTLAGTGREPALKMCRSLLEDQNDSIVGIALCGIGQADIEGRDKALYLAKCRQDHPAAFMFAGLWLDPVTISEMNSMLGTGFDDQAREVLNKMNILSQSNWTDRVSEILHGTSEPFDGAVNWSLAVMKRRAPEQLKPILREVLDGAIEYGKRYLGEGNWNDKCEQQFRTVDDLTKVVGIKGYDDMLVAYWQVGGELRDIERARLRTFGYACDSKERLAELLSEQQLVK